MSKAFDVPLANDAFRQRFWSKVDRSAGPDACWPWTASRDSQGYGTYYFAGTSTTAHRTAFKFTNHVGALEVDHICHNKACCNPVHLRAVTHKENMENLSGAYKTSTTGVRGVYRHRKRFRAQLWHHKTRLHLGTFDTIEEANAAVTAKRCELFTHNDADRVRA